MNAPMHFEETMVDYVTGRTIPNTGAEMNRQATERLLVEVKGYDAKDIEVDAEIDLEINGVGNQSTVDLVIRVKGLRFMAIKCARVFLPIPQAHFPPPQVQTYLSN